MQEKVVYFLGAGFSAPMGVPVMKEFLTRSKDVFFSDRDRFPKLEELFKAHEGMDKASRYYNLDRSNIEHILSFLEMEDHVTGSDRRGLFTEYLKAVIEELTPELPTLDKLEARGWHVPLFGPGVNWRFYATFVASLFNLVITGLWTNFGEMHLHLAQQREPSVQYAVISLNYDMVLERCLDLILRRCHDKPDLGFARDREEAKAPRRVPLAKLHGSVDGTIVPPTWNKTGQPKEIREAWKLAYKVLSEATQIRILGYSLPPTDIYVGYLLGAASTEAPHLKRIDVGCLDRSGSVEDRYIRFLDPTYRRFERFDILDYLNTNWVKAVKSTREEAEEIRFNKLEATHETAFAHRALSKAL